MCDLANNKHVDYLISQLNSLLLVQVFPFKFLCCFYSIKWLYGFTKAAQMGTASVNCCINSISRFIHLVSCQRVKPVPLQKNCTNMVGVLKRMKPVLDDVVDYKIPLDENLYRECEELDMQVNEAREFIEKWSPKMSKILSVSNYYIHAQTNTIIQ